MSSSTASFCATAWVTAARARLGSQRHAHTRTHAHMRGCAACPGAQVRAGCAIKDDTFKSCVRVRKVLETDLPGWARAQGRPRAVPAATPGHLCRFVSGLALEFLTAPDLRGGGVQESAPAHTHTPAFVLCCANSMTKAACAGDHRVGVLCKTPRAHGRTTLPRRAAAPAPLLSVNTTREGPRSPCKRR